MVQYRYALNPSGELISADSLAGNEISDAFICISCDQPMIARVNGKIKRPHFAHKVQIECNGETYLHRLAKQVFRETYIDCLTVGIPFTIALTVPRMCEK